MKTLARLLRRAADRFDPQPASIAPLTTWWYGTAPGVPISTTPQLQGRCERCGQWFYGSHACWTVDLSPWGGGPDYGTYTTSVGTNR